MTEPDDHKIEMTVIKEGKGILPAIVAIIAFVAILTWLVM